MQSWWVFLIAPTNLFALYLSQSQDQVLCLANHICNEKGLLFKVSAVHRFNIVTDIAEDQSGNFFTRETELFTKVVSEYVRKYLVRVSFRKRLA